MTNFYVNRFKEVIEKYYNEAQRISKEISFNNENYQVAIADVKNKELATKKETLYVQAKDAIHTIFTDIKLCLANMNFPSVENLTADRLFFSSETPIELTKEQILSFIERYRNNPTMLSVFSGYIEKNHNGFDEWLDIKKKINTPEKQVIEYQKLAKSALSLINTINANPLSTAKLFIDDYCTNENANFWGVIGNGMNLADYRTAKVPESAQTVFDKYIL